MKDLRFGASTWFFQENTVCQALQAIKECGFQAAEVWMEHLWKSGESAEEVRRTAESLSLSLSLHAASYDVNITSANPGIRKESLRQVQESLQIAARLGAGPVVVHAGRLSSTRGDLEEYWNLLEEAFRFIEAEAGKGGLQVGIEAMEKRLKEVFVSPAEIRRMMSRGWENIGLTVDLAHIRSVMDHEQFFSQIEAGWICHAHLSDFSSKATHVPLGKGFMEVDRALRALAARYRGNVILEGFLRGKGRKTVRTNRDFLSEHGWM